MLPTCTSGRVKTFALYFSVFVFSSVLSYGLPVNGITVPSLWIVRPSTARMLNWRPS